MLAAFSIFPHTACAVLLDALDPARQWRVQRIEFFGNKLFAGDELSAGIVTKERPWYRFWEDRPAFDPVSFETDLERLRRFYESRGYYNTDVTYDLNLNTEDSLVAIRFDIRESEPVLVSAIDVEVRAEAQTQTPPPLPESLPLKRGDIFNEAEYQKTEQLLRAYLANEGYAHVKTERKAEVDLEQRQAQIGYSIQAGPVAQFGDTEIKGMATVEPEVISRELVYQAGETYSLKKVLETRDKLLVLRMALVEGLDRYAATELLVLGEVHRCHAACAELPHDEVAAVEDLVWLEV